MIKDTVIHYSIWDSYANVWIPDKVFYTAKMTDSDHFTFNALGDSRTNLNDWNSISNAVSQSDFVLFGGDLVNSGGSTIDWDGWFTYGKNFLEKNTVFYNAGNHDISSDATASNFRNLMVQPPNPGNELYYSFTVGNAVFICLNSNDPANIVQYNWLINTLENNKNKKWRFVFYHKPFYTSPSHAGEMDPYYTTWWKAFDDYGVEVIFNGHTHNYQRSKPINRNISLNSAVASYGHCANNGRCQIVAGSAGAPRVAAGTGWFIEKSMDIMHFVNVVVSGDTLLFKTISNNNTVIDSFMIFKPLDIDINTPSSLCSNDTLKINLKANGGSGDLLNWNKDSINGYFLGSEAVLSLPLSDTTTTYFVSWKTAGIITSSASVNISSVKTLIDSASASCVISALKTNSCGDTSSINFPVTIKKLPDSTGIISGNIAICKGQTYTYSVEPIANADTYLWTLPNGVSGSAVTNSIDLSFGANAISGNIYVKGANNCGFGSASSLNFNVKNIPAAAVSVVGIDTINQGENNIIYSALPINDATEYIWTLPLNSMGSSDSSSIILSFPDSSISGNLIVKGQNECGTGEPSSMYINVFKSLEVKLFLEGLYAGNQQMNTTTNELGNPRWGSGNADKITIELRDSSQNYQLICIHSANCI